MIFPYLSELVLWCVKHAKTYYKSTCDQVDSVIDSHVIGQGFSTQNIYDILLLSFWQNSTMTAS